MPALGGILLALAGCGVNAILDESSPPPKRNALLPLEGSLAWQERELIRSMLRERLRARGVQIIENAFVDRVLSERGLLSDPERFHLDPADRGAICRFLEVDGVVSGRAFDTPERSAGEPYRTALRGELEWYRADGSLYWQVEHCAAGAGDAAVRSGQVITAVREQVERGTSSAWLALIEGWLDTVLQTLPALVPEGRASPPPPRISAIVRALVLMRAESFQPGDRIVVEARASAGVIAVFDLLPSIRGVPMVEIEPGLYRGEYRLISGDEISNPELRIRVCDRFGRESSRAGRYLSQGGRNAH